MGMNQSLIVLALAFVTVVLEGQTTLPAPKAGFSVGRSVLFWTDASHREKAGPEGHNPRELAAYFYYPAEAKGETAEYFPGLAGLASAPETKMLSSGLRGGLSLEEPSGATHPLPL